MSAGLQVSATAAEEAAPPGALQMPAMAQARTVTHDPFDGAEGDHGVRHSMKRTKQGGMCHMHALGKPMWQMLLTQ